MAHPCFGAASNVVPLAVGRLKRERGMSRNKNFKGRKPKRINRIVCWFCRTNECSRCLSEDYGMVCICEKCHPERANPQVPFEDGGNFKPKVERRQYDAKQVARELGIDPKAFRKFLRSAWSPLDAAGQGGRYLISRDQLSKVVYAYQGYIKRKEHQKYRKGRSTPEADDPGLQE